MMHEAPIFSKQNVIHQLFPRCQQLTDPGIVSHLSGGDPGPPPQNAAAKST